ncbi:MULTISPECIES: hypothetical protein [Pseudanabaena]|uniref:Uncharacterized protein n=2 Tax=Pseudanabaena TaxID=1152 RepID=L8N7T2_9CYAN|nr:MULTISPECIES: hypothetical protein [Pseudanabaena]ELS34278.1 hypothetical protein Pse7429DRAFT_0570 [Pseudanabaena biceps PCC 7429]MDG3493501.1 hypothetical protein [Pseudanabaena catenata USMAC16]
MLQKIYWLKYIQSEIQSENIQDTQEFRTIFCNHEFPHLTFLSPAFLIVGGGIISNTYAWTLAINNYSIFVGAGSSPTPVDAICKQIRLLLILRMNLFFAQSPEEVDQHCNKKHSAGKRILPDMFRDTSNLRHEEIEALNSWLQKTLSIPRKQYLAICQALTAYERALHVLSSDPTLSYSLLVFALEALANGHPAYQATWDNVSNASRDKIDNLLQDERISPLDETWADDLRRVLVDIVQPKATKRFTDFALDHIPPDLYKASNSNSKSQLRRSRIRKNIENAYDLRSSFSHALKLLPQFLIDESERSEEVESIDIKDEKVKTSYLTLRGLFRVVRSIILEFIEKQEAIDLRSHPWIEESDDSIIRLNRNPAYLRMKSSDGNLFSITSQYAQNWFEDILVIYQDNYIEKLHEQISKNQTDLDLIMGIATSGSMAGRAVFRFDPNPSYDWKALKEQALSLISSSKKSEKEYLQAITLLCTHLEMINSDEEVWDTILKKSTFGDRMQGLQRFVVDVIHDKTQDWKGKQAEALVEQHFKTTKFFIPIRIEIACMLEIARLFQNEGADEERKKWLNAAYEDASLYPSLQTSIQSALESDNLEISPQEILFIPNM